MNNAVGGFGGPMTLMVGPSKSVHVQLRSVPEGAPPLTLKEELMMDPDFDPTTPRVVHDFSELELSEEDKKEVDKLKEELQKPAPNLVGYLPVRIGLLGNTFTGKSSLVDTFVHNGEFSPTPETLGMGFIVRDVVLNNKNILMTFYDLGGRKEYVPLLPMTVVGAAAVIYVFDLENVATINAIKNWYRQGKLIGPQLNVLVGTKFDLFIQHSMAFQKNVTEGTKAFARAMHAPLFFTSAMYNANVFEVFKVVLSMLLGLECNIPEISEVGQPIRLFHPPYCPVASVVLPPEKLALASEAPAKKKTSADDTELEEWDVDE